MNPVIFNCVLLYILVIFLSLVQSRFRLIKDSPLMFLLVLFIAPVIGLKGLKVFNTWPQLTGVEIVAYTLLISYFNCKRVLPKINEGYIYAYTLLHWYLLYDSIQTVGFNIPLKLVTLVSIYPTFLIIKNCLQHKELRVTDKIMLFYWFVFAVVFSYVDQIALDIVTPVLTFDEISAYGFVLICLSAVQLYFISTFIALLYIANPLAHWDKNAGSIKKAWRAALKDWRNNLKHKLSHYIEYQISPLQLILITATSLGLFYLDHTYSLRAELIVVYTFLFPIIFFYLKLTPEENIEPEKRRLAEKQVEESSTPLS